MTITAERVADTTRVGGGPRVTPSARSGLTLLQIAADVRAANSGRTAADIRDDFSVMHCDMTEDRRDYDEREDFLDWCAAGRGIEHPRHAGFSPRPPERPGGELGFVRPAGLA